MPVLIKLMSPLNLVRAGSCPVDVGDYLDVPIVATAPVQVTMQLLPALPTTALASAKAPTVSTTPLPSGATASVPSTTMPTGVTTALQFSLGNVTGEQAGHLHKLVVTVFGNDGASSTFTFHYFRIDPTTTTTSTTTTTTTTTPHPSPPVRKKA
jgi:hypothetical protein